MSSRHRHRSTRFRVRMVILCVVAIVAVGATAVTLLVVQPVSSENDYAAEQTVLRDGFDRADSPGWGTADSGETWISSADDDGARGSVLAVADDEGVMSLGADGTSASANPSGVRARDVELSAVLAFGGGSRSTETRGSLVARGDGSDDGYSARLAARPDGGLELSVVRRSGGRPTMLGRTVDVATALLPRQRVRLEFRVTGLDPVHLVARAWLDGSPPGSGRIDVHDTSPGILSGAGAIGVTGSVDARGSGRIAWSSIVASAMEPVPLQPRVPTRRAAARAGAPAPGTHDFAVPADALVVAPGGRTGAAGTVADPFGTISAAITAAPDGATVAVRGGVYAESVVVPADRRITLQPYRREAVWLEGSDVVSGWRRVDDTWIHDGWTERFDASPTYTRGVPDGAGAFSFVGPQAPLAAHPDQMWFDGAALRQVSPGTLVGPGEFAVDEDRDELVTGSDPRDSEVRASARVRALTILGAGSLVQGIGVRRYSPSVPDLGSVLVAGSRVTVRDVTIEESATTGLSVISDHGTVDHVTTTRSGMLGMHANYADHLLVDGLEATGNNTERFNRAPVSGGLKITRSRHVEVRDSQALENAGNGIWFDESDFDVRVLGNDIRDSTGSALVIELSSGFVVAGNVITGNAGVGVWINDSGHGSIWNNTVSGSDRALNLTQGTRRASDLSVPGHDPRRPKPDPTVTWVLEDVRIGNNVLADSTGNCVLCVEDHSHERSADRMDLHLDGDLLQRGAQGDPAWLVVWSRGEGDPAVFRRLSDFVAATGQERQSLSLDRRPVVADSGRLLDAVAANAGEFAQPLPASVARELGHSSGARVWGAPDS